MDCPQDSITHVHVRSRFDLPHSSWSDPPRRVPRPSRGDVLLVLGLLAVVVAVSGRAVSRPDQPAPERQRQAQFGTAVPAADVVATVVGSRLVTAGRAGVVPEHGYFLVVTIDLESLGERAAVRAGDFTARTAGGATYRAGGGRAGKSGLSTLPAEPALFQATTTSRRAVVVFDVPADVRSISLHGVVVGALPT